MADLKVSMTEKQFKQREKNRKKRLRKKRRK